MTNSHTPSRPILSKALHLFAEPLAQELGDNPNPEMMKTVFSLASSVWNALAIDQVNGNHRQIEQLRKMSATEPITASTVEELIHRKNSLFADDNRLIGGFKFGVENKRWVLRVQERTVPAKKT